MRRGTGKIKSIADDQLADRSERGDDDLALADSPSDSAIDAYIDAHGADAVSGLLTPLLTAERIARIDGVLAARLGSVTAVVEDTYDPRNVAATMRTCEGLGIHGLHAIHGDPTFMVSKGVTRSCHQWMDVRHWTFGSDCVAALRKSGFAVVATLPDAVDDVETIDIARPTAVVFGNEHDGMSPELLEACDGAVRIPMFGFTESFNLSVSVALVMSRLATRRRQHLGIAGDLPEPLRQRLRARWFARKVRGATGILQREFGTLQPT